MNIKDIPLIIPNFNQLTYLKNLINWWQFYYPENPIHVIDNGSDIEYPVIYVTPYPSNDFVGNLKHFLTNVVDYEYYVISDPDIMPHPATPPNFLEIFKHAIDHYGFHHAGFDLITEDIPDWNPKQKWIQGDEGALKVSPVTINYEGKDYKGHKAPIDTCFALYKRDNGGWSAPMPPANWDNSLRLFKSFHFPWYLDKDRLPEEMRHYYQTCLGKDDTKPSAGRNHYNILTQ